MASKKNNENKRKRILASAMKIFAEQGINNGTIASIAKEADVGKGTIYEYFRSKDEIFEEMISDFFESMMGGWKQLNNLEISTIQKIEKIFEYSFDFLFTIDEQNFHQLIIVVEIMLYVMRKDMSKSTQIDLGKILQKLYKIIEPIIENGIKEKVLKDIDKEYFAFILFSSLDGIALHYYFQRNSLDNDKLKKYSMELFFNGILAEKTPSKKPKVTGYWGMGSLIN